LNAVQGAATANTFYGQGVIPTFLGRAATSSEISAGQAYFAGGGTVEGYMAQELGTTDYFNRAPLVPGVTAGPTASNTTFVQALYLQLYGKVIDAATQSNLL